MRDIAIRTIAGWCGVAAIVVGLVTACVPGSDPAGTTTTGAKPTPPTAPRSASATGGDTLRGFFDTVIGDKPLPPNRSRQEAPQPAGREPADVTFCALAELQGGSVPGC